MRDKFKLKKKYPNACCVPYRGNHRIKNGATVLGEGVSPAAAWTNALESTAK